MVYFLPVCMGTLECYFGGVRVIGLVKLSAWCCRTRRYIPSAVLASSPVHTVLGRPSLRPSHTHSQTARASSCQARPPFLFCPPSAFQNNFSRSHFTTLLSSSLAILFSYTMAIVYYYPLIFYFFLVIRSFAIAPSSLK